MKPATMPHKRFALVAVATLLLSGLTGLFVYAQGGAPGTSKPKSPPAPGTSPLSPKDRGKTDPVPSAPPGGAPSSTPQSTPTPAPPVVVTQPVIVQPSPTYVTPDYGNPVYVAPSGRSLTLADPTLTPPLRERVPASAGNVSVMLVERIDDRTLRYMIVDPDTKTMSLMQVHLGRARYSSEEMHREGFQRDESWMKREVVTHYVDR